MLYTRQEKELDKLAENMGAIKKAISYYDNSTIGKKRHGIFATYYFDKENKEIMSANHDIIGDADIEGINTIGVQDARKRHWGSIFANEIEGHEILPSALPEFIANIEKHKIGKEGEELFARREDCIDVLIIKSKSAEYVYEAMQEYKESIKMAAWLGYDLNLVHPIVHKDEFIVEFPEGAKKMDKRALVAFAFEQDPGLKKNILDNAEDLGSIRPIASTMEEDTFVEPLVNDRPSP